jgi:hypothetical protein
MRSKKVPSGLLSKDSLVFNKSFWQGMPLKLKRILDTRKSEITIAGTEKASRRHRFLKANRMKD